MPTPPDLNSLMNKLINQAVRAHEKKKRTRAKNKVAARSRAANRKGKK